MMKKRSHAYFQIKKLVKLAGKLTGCIEFPHFGAHYPDAACIDGYLWDLDSSFYEGDQQMLSHGGDDPCPCCRTRDYIKDMLDNEYSIGKITAHLTFIYNRYGAWKS